MHSSTKAIRTRVNQTNEMEHTTPLFLTSSFCFDTSEEMRAAFADETDDNIYSRFSNPNVQEFTDRMCALEGAETGYATASGMSAVFGSFMALVFGNEHSGVSEEIRQLADGNFIIPQAGIIRSLNISVACAVTLYEAYRQKSLAGHYDKIKLDGEILKNLMDKWGYEDNE